MTAAIAAISRFWTDYGPLIKPASVVVGVLLLLIGIPGRLTKVERDLGLMQADVSEVRSFQRIQLKRDCLEMTPDERVQFDMAEACSAILRGLPYSPADRTATTRVP